MRLHMSPRMDTPSSRVQTLTTMEPKIAQEPPATPQQLMQKEHFLGEISVLEEKMRGEIDSATGWTGDSQTMVSA